VRRGFSAFYCSVAHSNRASRISVLWPHPNLFGLVLAQSQMVASHFDFDRISERGKTYQFDRRAHEQPHLQEAAPLFRSDLDFGDGGDAAGGQRSQRLNLSGHTQPTFEGRGSTKILSANWLLIARRALQTRQI